MQSGKSTKRKCNALKSIGSKNAAFKTKPRSTIAARHEKREQLPLLRSVTFLQCLKRSSPLHSDLMVKEEAALTFNIKIARLNHTRFPQRSPFMSGSSSCTRANCEPDIFVLFQFLKRNTHPCALQLDQAHGCPTNKIRFHRIFAQRGLKGAFHSLAVFLGHWGGVNHNLTAQTT